MCDIDISGKPKMADGTPEKNEIYVTLPTFEISKGITHVFGGY